MSDGINTFGDLIRELWNLDSSLRLRLEEKPDEPGTYLIVARPKDTE